MPRPFQIFSQSDYLIQIVDTSSYFEWQTVQIQISWLLRSQLIWIYTQISWLLRSQLIWIYTVCKGRVFPGSAGQGLSILYNSKFILMATSLGTSAVIVTRVHCTIKHLYLAACKYVAELRFELVNPGSAVKCATNMYYGA